MSSQDPTPREGPPIPATGPNPSANAAGEPPASAPVDPLWAPTGAQRMQPPSGSMPLGMPAPRQEPARTPYGQAPVPSAASPTMAMPSTGVPRVPNEPMFESPTVADRRPSMEVPIAYEQSVIVPPPKKPVWPWVVAVLAVLLGGLVGWLVAQSDDDTVTDAPPTSAVVETTDATDSLGAQLDEVLDDTRANGAYAGSGIPQLDEIVEIDRIAATESLQNQVDLLSIAQEQSVATITELEEQVASLEESLAEVTAERDELKADAESGGMSDSEFLARLQEKEDRIATLEDQLATTSTQLGDAQEAAQKAADDLRAAQAELQSVKATLDALQPKPIDNYVDVDIARVRSDAAANGWTLVEEQVDSPTATPNAVTTQLPAAGSTVVRGSVLYVEYAEP